jgi:hypothetical protein
LLSHQAAERKQRQFQPLQEQRQAQENENQADENPGRVVNRPAQHKDLESEQDDGDRQHVPQKSEKRCAEFNDPFHSPAPRKTCRRP